MKQIKICLNYLYWNFFNSNTRKLYIYNRDLFLSKRFLIKKVNNNVFIISCRNLLGQNVTYTFWSSYRYKYYFLILLSANIGKISIKDAISYNMVMMIILSTSEFIGIFVLYNVFKINMSLMKPRSLIKIIYFIPSFTLFVFSVFTMNKFINREE